MNLDVFLGAIRLLLLRFRLELILVPALALKEIKAARSKVSFSQFREDTELASICPLKGYYIDIGSGRPISGSNTFLLYKRGWSGILIDPIKINILLSKLIRPRDKKLCAAIGTPGANTFYHLWPYEYSTTSREICEELIKNKKARMISKTRLDVIGIEHIFKGPINLCLVVCIDAEGQDLQILLDFPFHVQKPDVICVEEYENKAESNSEISKFLTKKEYTFYKRLGLSVIYVHKNSKYITIDGGGGGI